MRLSALQAVSMTVALSSAIPTVWQPAAGTTWQIVLNSKLAIDAKKPSVSPDVAVFDIDMFAHQGTTVVASLHQLGKKVICYFSAGTAEDWRDDYDQFPGWAIGNALPEWEGEYWIDIRDSTVKQIMAKRIKIASQMGCDAIDPDNMDGYAPDNNAGFPLTTTDASNYLEFLRSTAAGYGMATGLKNAQAILPAVASKIQFAVNEQCANKNNKECKSYTTFVKSGKPVFHIEYWEDNASWTCAQMKDITNFSTVIKNQDLDGQVTYCDGKSYITATDDS